MRTEWIASRDAEKRNLAHVVEIFSQDSIDAEFPPTLCSGSLNCMPLMNAYSTDVMSFLPVVLLDDHYSNRFPVEGPL